GSGRLLLLIRTRRSITTDSEQAHQGPRVRTTHPEAGCGGSAHDHVVAIPSIERQIHWCRPFPAGSPESLPLRGAARFGLEQKFALSYFLTSHFLLGIASERFFRTFLERAKCRVSPTRTARPHRTATAPLCFRVRRQYPRCVCSRRKGMMD